MACTRTTLPPDSDCWDCAKLTQKVFCCLTAVVAKLWQAAGVPGAVCRVVVDSQFDKYVDRSTPCEPICCVNISSSVWNLVLRSSVNWLTIGLQISTFPTLISSPLYSILSGCHSHYSSSPFISLLITQEHYYIWQLELFFTQSVSRDGKRRSVRRYSSLPLVGVHAL